MRMSESSLQTKIFSLKIQTFFSVVFFNTLYDVLSDGHVFLHKHYYFYNLYLYNRDYKSNNAWVNTP